MATKATSQKLPNTPEEAARSLRSLIAEMRTVPTEGEYYTLTLSTDRAGNLVHGYQSSFAGHATGSPLREKRAPSLVHPKKMIALWESIKQPWLVVNNITHLSLFLRLGGNAIIKKVLSDKHLSVFYSESECAYRGPISPPISISALSKEEKQRAPTPKLRSKILARDEERCMRCGSRPFDNPHVQLEVHHIMPWALGGLTTAPNLITLCQTCHTGLEPHNDWRLYNYVRPERDPVKTILEEQEYEQTTGVIEYRKKMSALFAKLEKKNSHAGQPRKKKDPA